MSEKPSKSQISFYFFFRPKEILSQRLGVFCDSFTITDCKTERNNIVVNLQPKGNDGFLFSFICKKPQMEHTEGVRKLNFVLSLTDAILEVISARGTPFTVLTDSVAIRQVRI